MCTKASVIKLSKILAPSTGSRHITKMAPAPENNDRTDDQDDSKGLFINWSKKRILNSEFSIKESM